MDYVISPWIFYFINLFSTLKLLNVVSIMFIVTMALIYFCMWCVKVNAVGNAVLYRGNKVDVKHTINNEISKFFSLMKKWIITALICIFLFGFITPTKETMYTMLISSNITWTRLEKVGLKADQLLNLILLYAKELYTYTRNDSASKEENK